MLQSENTKPADMIFCSYGFRSPIINAKLAKVIKQCENKTCVIIPFAGFDPEKTADLEKEALVSYESDREMTFDFTLARSFADWTLEQIYSIHQSN
jgi:hypothetical protein